MSYLLRTFDCAKMYNFCMGLWPYTYIGLPILNVIARNGIDEETGRLGAYTTATLWTGIAIVLTLSRVSVLAFGSVASRRFSEMVADLGQAEHDSHQRKCPFTGIFRSIKWHCSVFNVLRAIIRSVLRQVIPGAFRNILQVLDSFHPAPCLPCPLITTFSEDICGWSSWPPLHISVHLFLARSHSIVRELSRETLRVRAISRITNSFHFIYPVNTLPISSIHIGISSR